MPRSRTRRRSRRLIAAGVMLLAGCGQQTGVDPSWRDAAPLRPAITVVQGSDRIERRVAPRASEAPGPVVQAWYPFGDPPLPSIGPADGSAAAPASSGAYQPAARPWQAQPSPPLEPARATRYVVDSPYGLGSAPEEAADTSDRGNALRGAPQGAPDQGWQTPPQAPIFPASGERVRPPMSQSPAGRFEDSLRHVRPVVPPTPQRPSAAAVADTWIENHPAASDASPAEPSLAPISATPIAAPAHRAASDASAPPVAAPQEIAVVAEQAAACNEKASELAVRGAWYTAQAQFIKSLRLVTQGLDAQQGTTRHGKALAAGLAALDEADDFLSAAASGGEVDLAAIVERHRTPVLRHEAPQGYTAITAAQRYYTFAQEQLASAVGQQPAASAALYGLGKLHTAMRSASDASSSGPRAIALHQAALFADSRNHLAANELGVLLARCGHYEAARAALWHSLSIASQAAVWNNLAVVHDRLGEGDLASRARTEAQHVAATAPRGGSAAVVWVDSQTFAQSSRPEADLLRGQTAKNAPAAGAGNEPAAQTSKKGSWAWPWK